MYSSARLLSLAFIAAFCLGVKTAPAHAQTCERTPSTVCLAPESYTHRVMVSAGTLLVTLATDRDAYVIGTPIHIWLSFQNTGSTTITIPNPHGIEPMDWTVLVPVRCDTMPQQGWPEDGCDTTGVFQCPGFFYFFGGPRILGPGQCFSTERIWDGLPERFHPPITPGLYNLFGGMTTGFYDFHAPPGGVKLPIQLQSSSTVLTVPTSWGLMKSRYHLTKMP